MKFLWIFSFILTIFSKSTFYSWLHQNHNIYNMFENSKLNYYKNLDYIHNHNHINDRLWRLEMNKFAALSENEFTKYKGYNANYNPIRYSFSNNTINIPKSLDWRTHNIVGPIKDQKQCGSCWAFSAIGALESQLMKQNNHSISLSEQNMVDCVKNVKSPDNSSSCCYGCEGGEMYSVYQYLLQKQHGYDDMEKQYPYTALDQKCKFIKSGVKHKITKYRMLPQGNETDMLLAINNIGPLSVGVNANQDWQLYKKGIYTPTENECSSSIEDQDHGVVVVGYGNDIKCNYRNCSKVNYWIIRNSWGKDWGEYGYMKLLRGTNACGVANSVIYPIVA